MKDSMSRRKTVRNIVIFCNLVTALAFLAPLLEGTPSNMGPGFILWGMAPLLTAIVLRIVTKDWTDFGIKPSFRKNLIWYIVSILAFPVLTVVSFFLGEVLSVSSFAGFSLVPFLKTFLTALPAFIVFALFEEVGWRGYLTPKLASLKINSFAAYAIIAVVWATWHLPYFRELAWVYSSEALITFIPRFYLAMFAFAIFYGEVRLVTGSIWPAVLMHGVMNAFGHPLAADYVKTAPGMDILVSSTGLFTIVFAGLIGVVLNRWREKKDRAFVSQ